MDEGHARPVDLVAQPAEQRGEDGERAEHRDRDDHDRRHRERAEGRVAGQEHACHRDDHGQARDEHGPSGGRGGGFERGALAAPCGSFLPLALQVEERVVHADREPDQHDDRAHVLVDRPDLARQREQPHRRDHGRQREEQRDACSDERAEREHEHDERHGKGEQAGALQVVADRRRDLLVGRRLAEAADEQVRVRGLRLVDGRDDRSDLAPRVVLVAADVEAHDRRAAVGGDLLAVVRVERAPDVRRDAGRRDARDDVAHGGRECGARHGLRVALDEDALLRRADEAVVEDLRHASGLAGRGAVVAELLRPDGAADHDGRGDKGDPAEGCGLPVRGAPTARAGGQVEPHGTFLSLACTVHRGCPCGTGVPMAVPGVRLWGYPPDDPSCAPPRGRR